jgi:hypothetical protein
MAPRRSTSVLAWGLFALWAAIALTAFWAAAGLSGDDSPFGLMTVGYALVGAMVASRHPGNAVGWLMLGIAVTVALQLACEAALVLHTAGYEIAAWAAAWLLNIMFYLALVFVPLVFPDGRLLSPGWRVVWWFDVVTLVAGVVVVAITPGDLSVNMPANNPIVLHGPMRTVIEALKPWVLVVAVVAVALSTVSMALRFRRSTGAERQQLKWFAAATLLVVGGLILTFAAELGTRRAETISQIGWTILTTGAVLAIPLATGVAILRYRLYDIDVVINRTLVYGALTAALVATYVVSILLLRAVLTPVTGKSDLAVAGSTLAVAAVFRPARSRIQEIVDRRFYRRRYDAVHTLQEFSTRLRHELDLDAVGADLCTTADETLEPSHVSLWLRHDTRA